MAMHYPAYGGPPPTLPPYSRVSIPPVDPITFRRTFMDNLATLTQNSRPIIQSLSVMAQEYVKFSDIVSQCLEGHIRSVPPWMKLPGLYLLDMISKNIYEPYARLFAAFIVPLFLEAYEQVDNPTRTKMEELVITWRTGGPGHRELFGVPAQVSIERGIWGDGGKTSKSGAARISKAQVLRELQFTLEQKERAVAANPYDVLSREHIGILCQLRTLVEAGVSQEDLQQINVQLANLMLNVSTPSQVPPLQPPTHWHPQQPQPPFPPQPPQSSYHAPPPVPVSLLPQQPINPPPSLDVTKIGDIVAMIKNNGTAPARDSESSNISTSDDKEVSKKSKHEASRAYRQVVLAETMILSTAEISRKRPRLSYFLYEKLPSQCKQCAMRFPDTPTGKKALDGHLDLHFRQNRKAKENVGRGHSRSWFVPLEDWIYNVSSTKGESTFRLSNPKAEAAAEQAKKEAELRAQFVVVPAGDEAAPISCPICKESLKPEFLEDDEEWVWKNAVRKDDKVYHATCYAEASSSTLAARLRNGLGSSHSRSATPEMRSRQTTPPSRLRSKSPQLAGMKRKGDESHRDGGTPPLKKVAAGGS